jgi:23S rRNA (uracil1939-C5)-methyltransferase
MARQASSDLRKGAVVTVEIASLADGGEGVSRQLGLPIFVNRTAPGDVVQVRLFDVRKDFARAELVQIISPAKVRREPPCKLFKVCGGCQWQHLQYQAQLDAKADIVRQAVARIAKLPPDLVLPPIAAENELFYRNKVQFPVAQVAKTGRVLAGYYQQNSHELVNIKHCPVQPEPLDRMLEAVKGAVEKQGLTIYDEKSGRGLLRHIAARHSRAHDQILLTLVLNCRPEMEESVQQKIQAVADAVMAEVDAVKGVCVNFNSESGNRIMGDRTTTVAGQATIEEVLASKLPAAPEALQRGIKYRLSSTSFFQVNSDQACVLLDQVLLAATDGFNEASIPILVDAYAGVGTMALFLSFVCGQVYAIEEWKQAVADGKSNAQLNGISNVDFACSSVEDEANRLAQLGLAADVVVVDPPRKGLHQRALSGILALAPRRIVYVSCNPSTLSRDLRILEDSGYKTKQIQPIDMFPQTYHIESVSVLERPEQKLG